MRLPPTAATTQRARRGGLAGATLAATLAALLAVPAGGAAAAPAGAPAVPMPSGVPAVPMPPGVPAEAARAATAAAGAALDAGPPEAGTSLGDPVDLDALFVGAHPDDEAFILPTLGQWDEYHDVRTGVVTITRGEGGGNAVGPEEGPALGLIREAEERRAVGMAGITEIFNLDEVDFYYTVSAPLTEAVWGEDALEKVVRLVRTTRPEILITMDPAPSPGNHGNHQEAARLAIEAFYAAADPGRFPEQITEEGLRPFAPAKILLNRARGAGELGPSCPTTFVPVDPSQDVFGVWTGRHSERWDTTWAAVARDAQREYASQGWAVFPDVPTDPDELGCNYFTQVDARVPFPEPGSEAAAEPTAILAGAVTRAAGSVPLGTRMWVTTRDGVARPGEAFDVSVVVRAPAGRGLGRSSVHLDVPDGWAVEGERGPVRVPAGGTARFDLAVTPPTDAAVGERVRLGAHVSTERGTGFTDEQVRVVPAVLGEQEPLAQVAQFERWSEAVGVTQLQGYVTRVLTLPSGGSRPVEVVVTNLSDSTESGEVTLDLPAGFAAEPATASYADLAPGETTTVTFVVTNTDPSLPTSNQGGTPGAVPGDYAYTITTTSSQGSSTTTPALELVPSTTVPEADTAPAVDGVVSAGEYAGPVLDISRRWEGEECTSAADCSATAQVTWHDDTLHLAVTVQDDVLGTRLDASDCKRHWRTDSVEIAIDPRGDSENTSTTFKAAVLPATAEGPPCYLRDADNRQGPGEQTAPGMEIASTVTEPYTGYVVEVAIPMAELPGAVDPDDMGLNVLVYDSDTQDRTGQTRLGWSVWGGVQGDPYRWGHAELAGYVPPAGRPATAPDPVIPDDALSSLESPQTLEQAVRIDVPLAGGPAADPDDAGWAALAGTYAGEAYVLVLANGPGRMTLFVRDREGTAGERDVQVAHAGWQLVRVPLGREVEGRAHVVTGFAAADGGTIASRVPLYRF